MSRWKELSSEERKSIPTTVADAVDNYAKVFAAVVPHISEVRRDVPKKVLLVGPGFSEPLGARVGSGPVGITAIDKSPENLRDAELLARALVDSMPENSRLKMMKLDFQVVDILSKEAELLSNDFDMVVAFDIDPELVRRGGLLEMAKRVRPGGVMFATKSIPVGNEVPEMKEAIAHMRTQKGSSVEQVSVPLPEFKPTPFFSLENLWVFKVHGPSA